MAETEGLSVAWDHLGSIARTVGDLTGSAHLAYELIQNAEDALGATKIRFDITDEALVVWNDGVFSDCGDHSATPSGCRWLHDPAHACAACGGKGGIAHLCDLHSFRLIASADKSKRAGTIGAFGIGFTAVYQVTDEPQLITGDVHWFRSEVREESHRIIPCRGCSECANPIGTTFILPWAVDGDSEFRQQTNLEPVGKDFPEQLLQDLVDLAPTAILFLDALQTIEIRHNGLTVADVSLTHEDDSVTVAVDGESRRWWIFTGEILEEHGFESQSERYENRSRVVRVAIADDQTSSGAGRLFAFLPTSESTHLPVHINADFIPRSDRSRIATEAKDGEWNRQALISAGSVLADNLEALYERLGPEKLWALLWSISMLSQYDESVGVDGWLADLWPVVAEAAGEAEILPTTAGEVVAPGQAWYLLAKEEEAFTEALDAVGFRIADPMLRPPLSKIARKSDLGIDDLSIDWITQKSAGVNGVPDDLIEQVWSEIEILMERGGDSSHDKLANLRIGVAVDGNRVSLAEAFRASDSAIEILATVGVAVPFLDDQRMQKFCPSLAGLAEWLTATGTIELVGYLSDADLADGLRLMESGAMIGLFEAMRAQLNSGDREAIAALPIFPSRGGFFRLKELSLAGGFTDPLGLAGLIDPEITERYGNFLEELGATELNLVRYVTDRLPDHAHEAVSHPAVWREVVYEISEGLGEVLDDFQAFAAALNLPLVETTRGFVEGSQAYFESPELETVLGFDYAATLPCRPSVRAMQRELDTSSVARPGDLIQRIEEIVSEPPSTASVTAIADIVRYVADNGLEEDDEILEPLRQLEWLPVKNEPEWFVPSQTAAVYEEWLFASQANFLALGVRLQQKARDFLIDGLGVQASAETAQVVDHLIHLAESESEVRPGVFKRLAENSDDAAIQRLRGRSCVPLGDGDYARPEDLYFGDHPFGKFRHAIGLDLHQYRALWNEIGVRSDATPRDAVDVLMDISAEFGPENKRLTDPEDIAVLETCWAMLDDLVDSIESDRIWELASEKCILGSNDVLLEPPKAVFEDDPLLADIFRERLGTSLVVPPDRGRRAMETAGVRSLRTSVRAEVNEIAGAVIDRSLTERIRNRQHALRRVFAEHDLVPELDAFLSSTQVIRVDRILVTYVFDFTEVGRPLRSETIEEKAHYDEEDGVFSIVVQASGSKWLEVARELVRAVAPNRTPSFLISLIAQALQAPTSLDAESDLDASGVARLQEMTGNVATPSYLDTLGQTGDVHGEEPSEFDDQDALPGSTQFDLDSWDALAVGVGGDSWVPDPVEPAWLDDGDHDWSEGDESDRVYWDTRESGSHLWAPNPVEPPWTDEDDEGYIESPESDRVYWEPPGSGSPLWAPDPVEPPWTDNAGQGWLETIEDDEGPFSRSDDPPFWAASTEAAFGSPTSIANRPKESTGNDGQELLSFRPTGAERSRSSRQLGEQHTSASWGTHPQMRLRSYVTPTEAEEMSEHSDINREIDAAGVRFVLEREVAAGRKPREMPHSNPGYDVMSHNELGPIERYIEVKSLGGLWGDRGVGLTSTQYEFAREKGTLYWLYVVESALSDKPTLYEIQDPAALIDEYRFDGGWAEIALTESDAEEVSERDAWFTEGDAEAQEYGVSRVPVFDELAVLGNALGGEDGLSTGWLSSDAGSFGTGVLAVQDGRVGESATYLLFSDQTPADPTGEVVLAYTGSNWMVGTYILLVDDSDGSLSVVIRPQGSEPGEHLEKHEEEDVEVYATFLDTVTARVDRGGRY